MMGIHVSLMMLPPTIDEFLVMDLVGLGTILNPSKDLRKKKSPNHKMFLVVETIYCLSALCLLLMLRGHG